MEPFQGNSQINQQQQKQHLDSQLQSDPSIDTDELTQALAKEFENLVLSCNDEACDRDLQLYSVPINGQDQNNQPVDDDVAPNKAVIEGESWNGADEVIQRKDLEKVLEADPEECRVLEDREFGESEIGGFENMNNNNNNNNDDDDVENESDGGLKSHYYPLRPDAEDCSYYLRTGMCKYGSNCKFNHPLRRNNQLPTKEIQRQREDNMEMHGQIECKYYLSPAGCKYGKSCKFSHGRGKAVVTPVVEFNFLGLPIRPGEKECPYYMRNGSCKYGPNCRFNHPDPGAGVSVDAPTSYGNDGPLPLQPPTQPNIPNMLTWSGPRAPDPTAAFVPVMYPPTQNMPPPNPDWNGYQAPSPVPAHVYPSSDRGLPIPPAFFLNNPPSDTNMYTHHQQPMVVSEYPERPGQPDCSYFMKTGDCKYRASCKFHHPKSRITRTTPSVLSDKGLPLRPDQNICTYYSRYGICKYGPSCKYDHPVNYNMNSSPAGGGYNGSGRPGPLIQQSV